MFKRNNSEIIFLWWECRLWIYLPLETCSLLSLILTVTYRIQDLDVDCHWRNEHHFSFYCFCYSLSNFQFRPFLMSCSTKIAHYQYFLHVTHECRLSHGMSWAWQILLGLCSSTFGMGFKGNWACSVENPQAKINFMNKLSIVFILVLRG